MASFEGKIRIFPEPCLRQIAKPVINPKDPQILHLIKVLERTLRSQKHGIGIAAPQIGASLQVALVDVSKRDNREAGLIILINPAILAQDDEILSREGCMSVPDYRGDIRRFNRISVTWMELSGKQVREDVVGIKAICIQHEIDHLRGKLFIDHIASLKRDLIPRKV